ncbi:MAG: UDP-N-acetylglucosamine--N-acetylmuramyl-(pentapeptide) pyrophosphoryl-undecaprenol N-acetylglucosamine transferase [Spirochaetes bacterium]|nr:UDP-N-acetylglucosamine--N-acetylmuramyl-(pentapeptide) pyrophosphoryl-undecaprenol N-acetylglucosamine transferase [Spirochaetota bacterium]
MNNRKILITGGGTGGHISPGIAIYEECRDQNIPCWLLVGNRDSRFTYLNEVDERSLMFYGAPRFTKNPFKIPLFLLKFLFSSLKIRRFIRKKGITDVIGMGGYVSAPALFAAKQMKKNIWLCEQNVVPGKVTQLFIRHAMGVFSTFKNCTRFIDSRYHDKIILAGNPIRKNVLTDVDKKDALKKFNLSHCSRVILAIGGSQGAQQINDLVLQLKMKYAKELINTGIIWCTGAGTFEKYKALLAENNLMGSIYISPFVEEIGYAYAASDLAISRSGSGVMVEMAAMELPSILIPYPYAAMNHQSHNADEFVEANAAVKIEGKDITVEALAESVFRILDNKNRYNGMRESCLKEAKTEAASFILKFIGDYNNAVSK